MKLLKKKKWNAPKKGFYGWYFKCQSEEDTVIFIASANRGEDESTGRLQIATKDGVWDVGFPIECFSEKKGNIFLAQNRFGRSGIRFNITTADLRGKGNLIFSDFTPLDYDIMGPFVLVPFMECRHSIISMRHKVNGSITLNDRKYEFNDAFGYWEGDRGTSFPSEYLWTQTAFDEGSLVLSVAEIPAGPSNFTGIIGVVSYQGKEYRFATYLGASLKELKDRKVTVKQGNMTLEAKLLDRGGKILSAPVEGDMSRVIHECLSCNAAYRFKIDGETIFAFKTDKASFEYEYKR